eukprot:804287-Lingulodinium_polyedra.AAC.1
MPPRAALPPAPFAHAPALLPPGTRRRQAGHRSDMAPRLPSATARPQTPAAGPRSRGEVPCLRPRSRK